MSIIIKKGLNLKEIKKEWIAHQLKRDPHFLSRREFLGQGAAGITALTFMPSIFSLMTKSQSARGADGFTKAAVVLTMPGGFSASPEVVPLDVSGNFLTPGSYRNLGRPGISTSTAGAISTKYGAPLWTAGKLFQMLEAVNPAITTAGGKVYVAAGWNSNSQDDSNNNPGLPGPHILASAAQAGGKFRILGTQLGSNTDGGGRGRPTAEFPGMKPAVATTLAQAQDLLTSKKGALSTMSTNSLIAASTLAKKLTEGAMDRFAAMNSGRQLAELSKSATTDLVSNVASEAALDPRTDPRLQQAFGITTATAVADPRVPLAASTKLLVDGNSPLMTVQLGANFDYHDGTAGWDATGGAHALVMSTVSPILRACAAAKKSVGIMLSTDGASSFERDGQRSIGDKNEIHGSIYIFLCMENETPSKFLLGGMKSSDTAGGSANTDPAQNILMKGPSYEGHVLTASLLGMQGLNVANFSASTIPADDFVKLDIFKK